MTWLIGVLMCVVFFVAGCLHKTPGWEEPSPLLLFLGGLFGAFTRAYAGQTIRFSGKWWESFVQMFHQQWTLWHILSGGAVAVIGPGIFQYVYKVELVGPPLFLLMSGFLVGGFGNFILVAILWRAGVFKDDPRANTPNGGT